MTESNRLQVALVRETTPGTTPVTPRMRKVRLTGEALAFTPTYVDSDELRDDRMAEDPILVMKDAAGSVNFELSYPDDESPMSEWIRSAMYNAWQNTPQFFNDGTPDSVITDAGTVADTFAVASGGTAVKAGHLVRATGFTDPSNNLVFRAASSTGTTIVGTALALTAEAAPPGTARLKVVGFEGASADITALADGLGSTALDFTTLGLSPGMWLKIGGAADASTFAFLVTAGATARANAWARITAIAADKITLDNLPTGWTTDAGTGKTIRCWVGDWIKNGVTQSAMTIEKGFLGQQTPTYIVYRGQTAGQFQIGITSRQKITGSVTFTGMSGDQSQVALDASPDAVTLGKVMAANANVGRIDDGGAPIGAPNWVRSTQFTINNNLRTTEAADSQSPVGVLPGECTVTGRSEFYFGSNALLQKFYNGTPSAMNSRVAKNGQAIIWQFPRITYRGEGNPAAQSKNTDVMLPLAWQSSKDVLTQAHVICQRVEYFE